MTCCWVDSSMFFSVGSIFQRANSRNERCVALKGGVVASNVGDSELLKRPLWVSWNCFLSLNTC